MLLCDTLITSNHPFLWPKWALHHFTVAQYFCIRFFFKKKHVQNLPCKRMTWQNLILNSTKKFHFISFVFSLSPSVYMSFSRSHSIRNVEKATPTHYVMFLCKPFEEAVFRLRICNSPKFRSFSIGIINHYLWMTKSKSILSKSKASN